MRKKHEMGGSNLADFRQYYQATIIKTVWYWHKNRNTDQWKRIESPELNPHTYSQLFYAKAGKHTQRTACSISGARKLDSHMAKNEMRTLPTTTYENKLQMD